MGREVRRTAPDWKHPADKHGHLVPLLADDMPPWTPRQATHFQLYETCTEGTPISPVMESPEALAKWLADTGASAFGSLPASYEGWLRVCRGEPAYSCATGPDGITSGVESGKP